MKRRLLGFFSGFPSHHFPPAVGAWLREALTERESLVFVSAWPEDYERNDSDHAGMYEMFLEYGISFERHSVIDRRWEAQRAVKEIQTASCVFLMGGHPGRQLRLIKEMELDTALWESDSVVLGVSAGAINMAERSLDTKESPVPYAGLGFADITVKPHFTPENSQVLSSLLQISMELPICAMEDDSAIFVDGKEVSCAGKIYWIEKGRRCPFLPERIKFASENSPPASKS